MRPRVLEECIVVGGALKGDNFLAKSRDRNYTPHVTIYRELLDSGIEIVYMHDEDTDYMEGMNSEGIGIVNAALLVGDDEKAVKGKIKSTDGKIMRAALECTDLRTCIQTLISTGGGIKGHTLVGNSDTLYTIEMTSKHNPVINKVKDTSKTQVRTNHGLKHAGAGYTVDRKPDDYLSSKIRQATAEVQVAGAEDIGEIAPSLARQTFDPESNYNMNRKTDNMSTTSQCAMNLSKRHFNFYFFPTHCEFNGVVDKTPEDYDPRVKINVYRYKTPGRKGLSLK
jgi:hypothetical protein